MRNPPSFSRPVQGALLTLLLACAPATAATQDEIARQMVRVLEAYAVYKMGRYEDAFSRYLALAEAGNVQGMLNAANMYAAGQGVPKDLEQALRWYRRAAEAGDGIGMFQLARAYEQGLGTAADPEAAEDWYRRAAEQDNADAQWLLGRRLYERGQRLAGLDWIRAAARQGEPGAQRLLSELEGGGATSPGEAEQTAVLRTLAAVDAAARARDAAAIVAPLDPDAEIRVRLPDGPGWTTLNREELQALWQATFERAGDYDYRRSRPELLAADGAVLAFSRISERFGTDPLAPELEIHETALLRLEGARAVIHRLRLDIRDPQH